MTTLRLGTFTRSVLLDVCRRTGMLESAGLDVVEVSVPSSPAQCTALLDGELDAVFTSPDNVLAYRFVPDNPLGRKVDVTVVAAIDGGLGLCLATAPSLAGADALRGHQLGVDVPNSGFALVAYALAAAAGLGRSDYEVVKLGSTPRRADALIAGTIAATVLNAGNELRASRYGCRIHARVTELGPYLGTVLGRLDAASGTVRGAVDTLGDALLQTASAIAGGAHDEETVDAATRLLGLDPISARAHLQTLRDPSEGLTTTGVVDPAAIETLVALRRRFLPSNGLDDVVPQLDAWVEDRAR